MRGIGCGQTAVENSVRWRSAILVASIVLLYSFVAEPHQILAQNSADLDALARMETLFNQQKDSGQWQAAGQTARQMVAFSQQRRMMPMLQMGALDCVAGVELILGNYDEAIKVFRQVVAGCEKSPPDNPQLRQIMYRMQFNGLTGIARCYRELGKYEESAQAFEETIEFANRVREPGLAAAAQMDLGHLRLGAGKIEEALEDFRASLPTLLQAARGRERTKHDMYMYASALKGMAQAYSKLGRYDEAEPLAKSGLAWMQAAYGREHNYTAISLKTLALIYIYQNRFEEALQLNEEALRVFRKVGMGDTPNCLGIMANLSRIYIYTGQGDKGIEMATLVVQKGKEKFGETHPQVITPLSNLGNVYLQLGRYEEAAPYLAEAMKLCQMHLSENHPDTLDVVRTYCSNEFLRGGDSQTLLAHAGKIIDNYQATPTSPSSLARIFSLRALIHDRIGERAKAVRDMEESLKYSEQQRTFAAGGERERATLFEDYSLNYGFLISWYAEQGPEGVAKAFKTAELMKARSFMDALHTTSANPLENLPAVQRAEFEAEEKRLRDALSQAQRAYDNLSDPTPKQQQQAAYAVYIARDRLYEHIVNVQNANPTYRQLITDNNQSTTLETVQQDLLRPKQLLLSFAAFNDRMFVFSVQADAVRFTELKISEPQAKRLGIAPGALGEEDLKKIFLGEEGLLSVLSRPKESSTLNTRLATLWEVLIPEQDRAKMLDDSLELVTLLPDGLLSLLPFETLVVSLDEENAEYLLDAGPPLAYAPSTSVLMHLAKRPAFEQSEGREPLLTLGDPDYGQVTSSGDGRAARVRAGLARLPFSGSEATWVSQHFKLQGIPSMKLMRGQATEAELRRMISGREIVHLACHGITEDQYGNFFGCLALAPGRRGDANDDGFLYTPEIYKLNLKGCELAILSACETNFGPQQTGEGVWALSRGFLVSGARRVVASNWVVNDEAGATLVSYFAHELVKKTDDSHRGYAASLQQAKQSLRKQQQWSHPFYWSGLLLVGPN